MLRREKKPQKLDLASKRLSQIKSFKKKKKKGYLGLPFLPFCAGKTQRHSIKRRTSIFAGQVLDHPFPSSGKDAALIWRGHCTDVLTSNTPSVTHQGTSNHRTQGNTCLALLIKSFLPKEIQSL